MNRLILCLSICIFALAMQGCSSIISGTSEQVSFDSEPKEATVLINGIKMGRTPLILSLKKEKGMNVTIEKPGFKSQTRSLDTRLNPWFWGNIIIGGVLGSTTDAASGAMWEYAERHFYVTLSADPSSSAKVYPSEDAKLKEFIVMSHARIIEDLSKSEGAYLDTLLIMMEVQEKNRDRAIRAIKVFAESNQNIVKFADAVIDYSGKIKTLQNLKDTQ